MTTIKKDKIDGQAPDLSGIPSEEQVKITAHIEESTNVLREDMLEHNIMWAAMLGFVCTKYGEVDLDQAAFVWKCGDGDETAAQRLSLLESLSNVIEREKDSMRRRMVQEMFRESMEADGAESDQPHATAEGHADSDGGNGGS